MIIEALIVGIVASVVGLLLGLALASGLFWLFDAVGFTLPNTGLTLEPRTVVVALLVGILVTLLASLRPALRATRVPPIAAVREGATLPLDASRACARSVRRCSGPRVRGLLLYGLFGEDLGTTQVLIWMGLGALLIFLGVALFSSRLVRPLAHVLGWPATQIGSAAGLLARDNAQRNPQRTASTAAALMIGLALVTLVATLAAGIVNSFQGRGQRPVHGRLRDHGAEQLLADPDCRRGGGRCVPGVTSVGNVRTGETRVFERASSTCAVDPGMKDVISMDWVEGSPEVLATLDDDGAFTDDGFAKDRDLSASAEQTPVRGHLPERRDTDVHCPGHLRPAERRLARRPGHDLRGRLGRRGPHRPKNLYSFVKEMAGGSTDANQAKLDEALADFPNAKAQDRETFIDNQIGGLSSILNILYVLLALSIVVSLFEIINTLVLTVFEHGRSGCCARSR